MAGIAPMSRLLASQAAAEPDKMANNKITQAASAQDEKKLKDSAADFEAMFLRQMLEAMRKTVPDKGGMMKQSSGEKTFREMLDGKYADVMSRRPNGLGLKEVLYQHLVSRYQQQAPPPNDGNGPGNAPAMTAATPTGPPPSGAIRDPETDW